MPETVPSVPPQQPAAAPPIWTAPAAAVHYSGFWRRFWAFWIDHIIVVGGIAVLAFGVGAVYVLSHDDYDAATSDYLDAINTPMKPVALLALWLYYALLESGPHQATVGKRVLGIKVTRLDGGRATFWRALGRTLAKLVSNATIGIGYIAVVFTARKQALHDLMASCLVVRR